MIFSFDSNLDARELHFTSLECILMLLRGIRFSRHRKPSNVPFGITQFCHGAHAETILFTREVLYVAVIFVRFCYKIRNYRNLEIVATSQRQETVVIVDPLFESSQYNQMIASHIKIGHYGRNTYTGAAPLGVSPSRKSKLEEYC